MSQTDISVNGAAASALFVDPMNGSSQHDTRTMTVKNELYSLDDESEMVLVASSMSDTGDDQAMVVACTNGTSTSSAAAVRDQRSSRSRDASLSG